MFVFRLLPRMFFRALVWTVVFYCLLFSPRGNAKTYVIATGSGNLSCATSSSTQVPYIPAEECPDSDLTPEVFLIYHGVKSRVWSEQETVGLLLNRLKIRLEDTDVVSHSPDTPVERGMHLRIDSVITRQETYSVTIPHETTHCADASLPSGQSATLAEGRDGELLVQAAVTYINGIEGERRILKESVTISPITEVIGHGTGAPVPEAPAQDMPLIMDDYIIMPTGEILTYYKTDNITATGYTHTDAGCDLVTSTGTTVHYGTAAVDPRFIPYGTRMLLVSHDGKRYYGIATAEDCGGAIKRDRIDLYFPTHQECIEFGKRRCTIYFLG